MSFYELKYIFIYFRVAKRTLLRKIGVPPVLQHKEPGVPQVRKPKFSARRAMAREKKSSKKNYQFWSSYWFQI